MRRSRVGSEMCIRDRNETCATHPVLEEVLSAHGGAMKAGSQGVAPLIAGTAESGVFLYPVDCVVLAAEWLKTLQEDASKGEPLAALELIEGVATILEQVAETKLPVSHGGLSPWRICITKEGAVSLVGYGIPALDMFAYLDEVSDELDIESVRYAPTERLGCYEEDQKADIYTLGVFVA